MARLLLVLVLCAGVHAAPSSDRIVGGEMTTVDNYPSIVQVDFFGVFTNAWGQSCAANILNSLFVLSAAHCFHGALYRPDHRRIRAGATFRNTGGVVINVDYEINHPTYDPATLDGDIAVVRLVSPLSFNPVVQQGTIPPQGFEVPDNMPVVHAGWGAIRWQGPASPQLQDVTIFTVNRQLCAQRYLALPPPNVVTENMICAGLLDVGGRDACQGDSGGPLYLGDVIIGIVSWGHQCANATFPGISAAVSPYTEWIVDKAE